jgi:putative addiction module killer protein
MIAVRKTDAFVRWQSSLRDRRSANRIVARIERMLLGNPGDVRPVGEGVSELRIDVGPGYRVYYLQRGEMLVVLLCGGDKSSQAADIARAKLMAREFRNAT